MTFIARAAAPTLPGWLVWIKTNRVISLPSEPQPLRKVKMFDYPQDRHQCGDRCQTLFLPASPPDQHLISPPSSRRFPA